MCDTEAQTITLSVAELKRRIDNAVTSALAERDLFEQDRALGRCPYCHGQEQLVDPVVHDKVPCICTGIDPRVVLGVA